MSNVVIFDIDGVISDCTERFRTLYEGKFVPRQAFHKGEVQNISESTRVGLNTQTGPDEFYYVVETGALLITDGEHLLRDLEPVAYLTRRNMDWEPDWDRFHDERMDKEPPHSEYIALAHLLHSGGNEIHLVTARSERFRERTIKYMRRHKMPYDQLHMRHAAAGWENSKQQAILDIKAQDHLIVLAIDDDEGNRQLYANYGIPFIHVPRGHHNGEVRTDN